VTAAALDDAALTVLLGPKCPACGWRTGHRGGQGVLIAPCPDATHEAHP